MAVVLLTRQPHPLSLLVFFSKDRNTPANPPDIPASVYNFLRSAVRYFAQLESGRILSMEVISVSHILHRTIIHYI